MTHVKGGFLVYKCRQCGELYKNVHAPDGIMSLIYSINGDKYPCGGIQPTMTTLHSCDKERTGIADLIGVEYDK